MGSETLRFQKIFSNKTDQAESGMEGRAGLNRLGNTGLDLQGSLQRTAALKWLQKKLHQNH
jgi:hypothetical protein